MAGTEELPGWGIDRSEIAPDGLLKICPRVAYYLGTDPESVQEITFRTLGVEVIKFVDFPERELSRLVLKFEMDSKGSITAQSCTRNNQVNYFLGSGEKRRGPFPLPDAFPLPLGPEVEFAIVTKNNLVKIWFAGNDAFLQDFHYKALRANYVER